MKKSFFYLFLFFSLITSPFITCCTFTLDQIPQEDREFFLSYFRKMLLSDFGFTLLGVKPLSLEEFSPYKRDIDIAKREKLFEYLRLIFKDSKKFSLRIVPEIDNGYEAFLINHKLFKEMNEDPNSEFQFETVRIGKLFGYGEENARFYARFLDLGIYLKKPPFFFESEGLPLDLFGLVYGDIGYQLFVPEIPYCQMEPKKNPRFSSLEEEWNWICDNMFDDPNSFLFPMWVGKPGFVCKKGKKTEALLKKYDLAANILGKMLHDEKWLDLVLKHI